MGKSDIIAQKKALRQEMLARRAKTNGELKNKYDQWVCEQLENIILENGYKKIHAYLPMGKEIDIYPLLKSLLEKKITVVVPKTLPKRKLENLVLTDLNKVEKGVFGTTHPASGVVYNDTFDLIIVPGSKNVLSDLVFLKNEGWDQQIKRHLRYGGKVLGICCGMQMLGNTICDPNAVESSLGQIAGLALSDFNTILGEQKVLSQVNAILNLNQQQVACQGYEIHAGISKGQALNKPLIRFTKHPNGFETDGFISDDNAIAGTYLHGLFDNAAATELLLKWLKPDSEISGISINEHRERQLERLAEMCQTHLNIEQIIKIYQGHNND